MALRTDDDRVSDQTPGYEKLKAYNPNALSEQEQGQSDDIAANYDDTADPQQEDANINRAAGINSMETKPSGGWQTNVVPKIGGVNQQNYNGKPINKAIKIAKKGGPVGIIIAMLLAAAGVISFVGGPGLLLVHFVETFNRFDWNSATLSHRSEVIINAKIKNSTTGLCTKRLSVKCKYSLMSQRQIDRFNNNTSGIKMITDGPGIRIGGVEFKRASSVEFDGRTMTAREFRTELRTNAALRAAMFTAYNWKFISKSYPPFLKFAGKTGFSKAPPFDKNDNDEERDKKLKSYANNNERLDQNVPPQRPYPDDCDEKCKADIDKENKDNADKQNLKGRADQAAEQGRRAYQPGTASRVLGRASGLLWATEACQIPYAIGAIGMGAKVRRSQQMIRYASMFLVLHSMIKAGDADPNFTSYGAGKLTQTFASESGEISKSGTDSFTYRYAAYNDTDVTESASLASVGGHIGGPAAPVAAEFSKPHYKDGCDIVTNPFLQGGVMLLSIVPGVRAANVGFRVGAQSIIQQFVGGMVKGAVVGYGISQAVNYFVELAVDATVGDIIDDETYGELAGDLASSGIIESYSGIGRTGGGLALTPEQAVQYENQVSGSYLTAYSEYERSELHPLDISSPNSALGSIYSNLMPHLVTASSSVPGMISSLQRITANIFSIINPKPAKAVTTEDYSRCLDYQYRELGIATTPLCHVMSGIPPAYINIEPNDVIDYLIDQGDIDEEGNILGDYSDFIDECFSGDILQDDTRCIADPESSDYQRRIYRALFYIDESIEDVFINGLPEQNAVNDVRSGRDIGEPGRFDDTSLSCPEGTTDDLGVITTRYKGHLTENENPKVRLCRIKDIPGFGAVPKGEIHEVKTGAVVNAAVAPMYVELARLAKLETSPKIQLSANSSFRIQDSCDIATSGAQCAPPGLSNHQLGISIDFALSDGKALSYPLPNCVSRITSVDPVWKFLNREGAKLGIKQIAHENWHWEAGTEGAHLCPA